MGLGPERTRKTRKVLKETQGRARQCGKRNKNIILKKKVRYLGSRHIKKRRTRENEAATPVRKAKKREVFASSREHKGGSCDWRTEFKNDRNGPEKKRINPELQKFKDVK